MVKLCVPVSIQIPPRSVSSLQQQSWNLRHDRLGWKTIICFAPVEYLFLQNATTIKFKSCQYICMPN